MLAPHHAERVLGIVGALIDRARYEQRINHEIGVAYDEWNVWFRTDDGQLEERYNLADTLAVATYLNVFVRQCAVVRMADLAQLVNVIAPIVTTPEGLFRQTIFHRSAWPRRTPGNCRCRRSWTPVRMPSARRQASAGHTGSMISARSRYSTWRPAGTRRRGT